MAVLTVVSTPTHRSLMRKSKDDLRTLIRDLHRTLDRPPPDEYWLEHHMKYILARRVLLLMQELPEDA